MPIPDQSSPQATTVLIFITTEVFPILELHTAVICVFLHLASFYSVYFQGSPLLLHSSLFLYTVEWIPLYEYLHLLIILVALYSFSCYSCSCAILFVNVCLFLNKYQRVIFMGPLVNLWHRLFEFYSLTFNYIQLTLSFVRPLRIFWRSHIQVLYTYRSYKVLFWIFFIVVDTQY